MASYEAGIKVLVDAQQAFAAIKKIEDRLKNVQDKAKATEIRAQVQEAAQAVTQKERELARQIDLNAATDLYNRRLQQINRAGGPRNAQQRKELAGLQKIVDSQGNSLLLVRKSATALGRILEVIRETNRTDKRSNELQRQVRAYQTQFDLLREQGVAESKLNEAIKLRDKLSQQQAKSQLDVAAITKDQLDQKLRLLRAEVDLKRAAEQTAAAEKRKAQQQGLGLRNLAGRFTPVINRTARLAAPGRQLALPSTEMLAPDRKGLERLKQVETSSERVARFVVRIANAYKRSAERSKSILADNKKAVKQGERRAKAAERTAKANERSQKAVQKTVKASKKAGRGGSGIGGKVSSKIPQILGAVGFPLLFGGGPASILGAGFGAGLGGFGGGIFGSALGQGVDQAVEALIEFASELSSATISLEDLITAAGLRGTGTAANIRFSEFLGVPEVGRAAGKAEVESIIGKEGVENFKNVSDQTKILGNAFSRLSLRLGSFFAPLISGSIGIINNVIGAKSPEQERTQNTSQAKQLKDTIERLEKDNVQESVITPYRILLKGLTEEQEKLNESTQINVDINEKLNQIVNDSLNVAKDSVRLEENRLGLRSDVLASQTAGLRVQEAENNLKKITLRLDQDISDAKRKELDFEKSLAEQEVDRLKAAQRNAVIEAQVRLRKEEIGLSVRINQESLKAREIERETLKLGESEAITYKFALERIKERFNVQRANLTLQREADLLLVNEEEKVAKIKELYDRKLQTITSIKEQEEERARIAEILRKDENQAFLDSINLSRTKAQLDANAQIGAADPFRNASFGSGFFSSSAKLDADQTQERIRTRTLLNTEINALQARIAELDKEGIVKESKPLKRNLDSLLSTKEMYEKLQPAIDAAALAQARYNDAFNLLSPAVSSIVSGLNDVVNGTKTAQEAFADMFRSIANSFLDMAAQILTQQLALGVLGLFFKGPSGPSFFGAGGGVQNGLGTLGPNFGIPQLATGGPVGANQPYIVGERGPELFVPRGSGTIVPNNKMGGGVTVGSVNITVENTGERLDPAAQKQIASQVNAPNLGMATRKF